MTVDQALYRELKDDLAAISAPLFELAEQLVRKQGAFLPFGAVMSAGGSVTLHAGATENDVASSDEVLPLVQAGVRQAAEPAATAAAVAEWVRIGMDGGALVDAVKVHVHHRRGLSVAFYITARKRLLRGWEFGDTMVQPSEPLVTEWDPPAA